MSPQRPSWRKTPRQRTFQRPRNVPRHDPAGRTAVHRIPNTMYRAFAIASFTVSLTAAAMAQGLALDKTGGGVGQSVSFQLQGPPNALYLLLFALNEAPTP